MFQPSPPSRGPSKSRTRLHRRLGAALVWAAGWSGAWAAPPTSYEPAGLRAWLAEATDLRPEEVVAVSRTSLSAISRRRSDISGSVFALVRSEALDPTVYAQQGANSWAVEVEVACDAREIRAGETQGYSAHNLKGAAAVLRGADLTWRRPTAGTQLDSVVRAVCEPAFKGPLAVARRDAPPPAPARAAPRTPAPAPARAPAPSRAQAQLFALSTPEAADRARADLAKAHADLDVRVVRATSAGRTVYRVVAGFGGDRDAAAFCRKVQANGRPCFVRGAGR